MVERQIYSQVVIDIYLSCRSLQFTKDTSDILKIEIMASLTLGKGKTAWHSLASHASRHASTATPSISSSIDNA
jgi:hypothetical protein